MTSHGEQRVWGECPAPANPAAPTRTHSPALLSPRQSRDDDVVILSRTFHVHIVMSRNTSFPTARAPQPPSRLSELRFALVGRPGDMFWPGPVGRPLRGPSAEDSLASCSPVRALAVLTQNFR